jgi:DNA-binding XRE family transcriptional regulator
MEQGITQMELAGRIGVHEITIINWEVKDTTPCSRYLEKLIRIMLGLAAVPTSDTLRAKGKRGVAKR